MIVNATATGTAFSSAARPLIRISIPPSKMDSNYHYYDYDYDYDYDYCYYYYYYYSNDEEVT